MKKSLSVSSTVSVPRIYGWPDDWSFTVVASTDKNLSVVKTPSPVSNCILPSNELNTWSSVEYVPSSNWISAVSILEPIIRVGINDLVVLEPSKSTL